MRNDFGYIQMNELENHMPLPSGFMAPLRHKMDSAVKEFRDLVLAVRKFSP
jgi:hypothetical protein